MLMKFDLFNELSVPAFLGTPEAQVFEDTLEQWALADSLGFSTGWLVEHHFMPEYSHSTAPALFLAAASQRTKQLRLGHAIIPLPYHHPVTVAENLATLDVLSSGRAVFGYGRGFSPREYEAFGKDISASRTYTEEALTIIQQGLRDGRVQFSGRHFQLHDLPILPRPLQQPTPPLWAAAVSPESFRIAAERKHGVLVGPFKPWFMIREDLKQFRLLTQNLSSPPPIAMTLGVYCHPNGRTARKEAATAFEWFYRHLLGQTRPILKKLYASYEYYRRFGKLMVLLDKTINLGLLDTLGMTLVGDPDHCRSRIRELQKAGVSHLLCAFGAGIMPSDRIRASMELFAEEVMPVFQNLNDSDQEVPLESDN